jgi:hypothetical protein
MTDGRKEYDAALERVRALAKHLAEHSDPAARADAAEALRLVAQHERLVPTDPAEAAQWFASQTRDLNLGADRMEDEFLGDAAN